MRGEGAGGAGRAGARTLPCMAAPRETRATSVYASENLPKNESTNLGISLSLKYPNRMPAMEQEIWAGVGAWVGRVCVGARVWDHTDGRTTIARKELRRMPAQRFLRPARSLVSRADHDNGSARGAPSVLDSSVSFLRQYSRGSVAAVLMIKNWIWPAVRVSGRPG